MRIRHLPNGGSVGLFTLFMSWLNVLGMCIIRLSIPSSKTKPRETGASEYPCGPGKPPVVAVLAKEVTRLYYRYEKINTSCHSY